jgi:hypothetical protein
MALDAIDTFRFLDLPLEVREMIYYEYLSVVKKPPTNLSHSKTKVMFPCSWGENLRPDDHKFPALCMVSSQLFNEAVPVYLRHFCSVDLSGKDKAAPLLEWFDRHDNINFTFAITSIDIDIDICNIISSPDHVEFLQRCHQLRDLRMCLWMCKKNCEEMTKGLEPEAAVDKLASALNLMVVVELPRLDTLLFTCTYRSVGVLGVQDDTRWLLPLKAWFQARWAEKHKVVKISTFLTWGGVFGRGGCDGSSG